MSVRNGVRDQKLGGGPVRKRNSDVVNWVKQLVPPGYRNAEGRPLCKPLRQRWCIY